MNVLIDFLVAVAANVIGHCVCKWLDRHGRDN